MFPLFDNLCIICVCSCSFDSQFVESLSWYVQHASYTEQELVSLERVIEYSNKPEEVTAFCLCRAIVAVLGLNMYSEINTTTIIMCLIKRCKNFFL